MVISWTQEQAGLNSWEGNGGTYYVDTPAENNYVVSALQNDGYNLVGSQADLNAISSAQQEVAQNIQQTYSLGKNPPQNAQTGPTTTKSLSSMTPVLIGAGILVAFLLLRRK